MTFTQDSGPIEAFEWGTYRIRGRDFGKDVRLVGGEASVWKERKGHELTSGMITGIDGQMVDVLIIGSGVNEQLHCPESVKEAIHDMGIGELIIRPTPVACRIYNELYGKGKKIALLAHGTC